MDSLDFDRGGLSDSDAAQRRRDHGPNELTDSDGRAFISLLRSVVTQPMLALLLAAGVINITLAEPIDGIVMFSFVLVVVGISLHQTWRTERALTALRSLTSPTAQVVRSGRRVRIPSRDVVPGDRLVLVEGDRIPADAHLIEGSRLTVDESMLTGESIPVLKAEEDDPSVFAGTLIGRGHGEAIVTDTGPRTRLGSIGTAVKTIERSTTPLQRQIDRIVRVIGIGALVVAGLVIVGHGILRDDWLAGGLNGIAVAMSMLPEEFPVVFTVFLAVGAWRMARNQVLVRRSPAIEALGAMTVACVDKTGTITLNRMTPIEISVDGRRWTVGEGFPAIEFTRLIEVARLASPIEAFDPIDRAIVSLDSYVRPNDRCFTTHGPLTREYPLSSSLFATTQAWKSPDGHLVATKGAPEAIGQLCRLGAEDRRSLSNSVEIAATRGLRVIAVAVATWPYDELPDGPEAIEFTLCGLICLKDPVRPGVIDSVADLTSAGVRTIMMTGDHPATALAIALEIGLDTTAGTVTGGEIDAMSDAEFRDCATKVNLFARSTPEHKLRLVRTLQEAGHVVAMTGDGVNDAPALKAADIGLAMGGRGTDVAREAASIVIADDSFSSIVTGVKRGRGIYENIRKAFAYVISMHAPIVGLTTIPLFLPHWPLVLLPIQIAFLELIIDPACSIVFEAESIDPQLMTQPPRSAKSPLLSRSELFLAAAQGLSVLTATFVLYAWASSTSRSDATVRSIVFVGLVISNVGLILINRSWRLPIWRILRERRNPALPWLLEAVVVVLGSLLLIPTLRSAFDFGTLSVRDFATAVGTAVVGVGWFEIVKAVRHDY